MSRSVRNVAKLIEKTFPTYKTQVEPSESINPLTGKTRYGTKLTIINQDGTILLIHDSSRPKYTLDKLYSWIEDQKESMTTR